MIHIKVQDDAHRPIAELVIAVNGAGTMHITGGFRTTGAGQLQDVDLEVDDPKANWSRVLKAMLSVETPPEEIRKWLSPPKTRSCAKGHPMTPANRLLLPGKMPNGGQRVVCRQCRIAKAQAKLKTMQLEVERLRAGGGVDGAPRSVTTEVA